MADDERYARRVRRRSVSIAIAIALAMPVSARTVGRADEPTAAVKAGFLFNFAKFVTWPPLTLGTSVVFCVIGDESVAVALTEVLLGQSLGGRRLEVRRPANSRTWRECHVLFVAESEARQFAAGRELLTTLPVVTVSDEKGFSKTGGMIELFIDDGRMRFAINAPAATKAGIGLSSRLLGLAKVVR